MSKEEVKKGPGEEDQGADTEQAVADSEGAELQSQQQERSWNPFGKKTETSATYITKFKTQTDFIFDDDPKKTTGYFGTKEKKPLKVILKSLYKEYYDKMMDGVLEFATEKQLDKDVINMFKRALQALAEKKRIDQAAPPYYYPEEGKEVEPSKSVISQMVVYEKKDDKETDKRLPILIYDPCIFELENEVKPSIDVETTIQDKFNEFELVGLLHEELHQYANLSDTEMNGGGKYVGGGVASLKEVLHQLNIELLKSNRYTPLKKGEIMDYSLTIAAMKERKQIRDLLAEEDNFDKLKEDFITKLLNGPYGVRLDSQKRKDLLKVIIEYYAKDPENYTIAEKEAEALKAAEAAETAIQRKDEIEDNRKRGAHGWAADREKARNSAAEAAAEAAAAAATAVEAAKEGNGIIFNTKEDDKEEEEEGKPILFVDFLENTIPKDLKDGVKKLLKRENIRYETTMYGNMKRDVKKGLESIFGSKKNPSAEAGGEEAEEAVAEKKVEAPDKILLKDILHYGVWKEKKDETPTPAAASPTTTDDILFMIEPKMMEYLLNGKTDGSYNPEVFLPINYIPKTEGSWWNGGQAEQTITMEVSQEHRKFYGREFSYNEYKYEVKGDETQENLFEQSEWYIEYKKTQPTKQGGQSKNTTAKKNKSKRNKSKKNKSKKNK
jgi:hypothetical protein